MLIKSVQNSKVKEYVKLMTQKKERDLTSRFVVEGDHLVQEAYKEKLVVEVLIIEGRDCLIDVEPIYVSQDVMNKICDTKSPQGIIALCKQKPQEIKAYNRILLLEDINDPGNLGTILRSADAFNFDGIILSENTVDLYNPKVIRATQGAIFRVNVIRTNLIKKIEALKLSGMKVYTAHLAGIPLSRVDKEDKMAFVMGNEAKGISQTVFDTVEDRLTIEMTGSSESLNVSIAASIIMYQFRN